MKLDSAMLYDPEVIQAFRAEKAQRLLRWRPFEDKADGTPHPQRLALESKADILGYGGAAGGGKLLALATAIPTPFGWTTMGEIAVGDAVIDERGVPCSVIAKSVVELEDTYILTFSDGTKIVAGGRHQWVTSTELERMRELRCNDVWRRARRDQRESRGTGKRPDLALRNSLYAKAFGLPVQGIRTTAEIANTLYGAGGRLNHSIAVAWAIQLPEIDLLVDPYVLGAWLGDGTTSQAHITGLDEEIFSRVANSYTVRHHANPMTRGVLGLKVHLRTLGVLGNKHIPSAYLRASVQQRLSLLQGLMDTDGHANARGQCEICLTRKVLIEDVHELILSLGIKATVIESVARMNGRVIGPKYTIKFLTDLPAFHLPRKLLQQKRAGFRGTHDRRYIMDVEKIDPVPMQCIQVDSPNHMYLCNRSMIPTHNSDLLLGCAGWNHHRSVIFRRVFPSLRGIIDRSREIYNAEGMSASNDSYNESLYRWKFPSRRGSQVRFGSLQYDKDVMAWQGQAHDFYGFDELTEFLETQFRYVIGWNRSSRAGQRCRVIATMNPPTSKEGEWVLRYFAPWLDDQHPNPAKQGELRWFTTIDGKDIEVSDGSPIQHTNERTGEPEQLEPRSRTFIFAHVTDNPILVRSGYISTLQALPEPLRSKMLYGDFKAGMDEDPWCVFPSAWVREAMKRWRETPEPVDLPIDQLGVDVARGGRDRTVLTPRRGWYFCQQRVYPGSQTPDGAAVIGLCIPLCDTNTVVAVDVIGVGSSPYDFANANKMNVMAMNGAEKSEARSKEGNLAFFNKRAEWHWRLRESLDPKSGEDIAIPDDPEVLADLCAIKWEITTRGIKCRDKDETKEMIGRSPDKGESIIYAHGQASGDGMGLMGFMKRLAGDKAIAEEEVKRRRVS